MAGLAWWQKQPTASPSRAGLAAHVKNRGGRLLWHRGGGAGGRTRAAGEAGFGVGRRAQKWHRPEGGSPTGEAVGARPGCTAGEASARMEDSAAAVDSGVESGDGSRGGGASKS
jgi:hypothetical protein